MCNAALTQKLQTLTFIENVFKFINNFYCGWYKLCKQKQMFLALRHES